MAEKPDCQSKAPEPFALKATTIQSLQILEDIPCDFSDWVETEAENKWVARTLKLWFFSRKNFAVIHKWVKWPEIVHSSDEVFFEKASKMIEDDVDEFD